jgi:glycosyltransferase involved in cell wall biosynthesis
MVHRHLSRVGGNAIKAMMPGSGRRSDRRIAVVIPVFNHAATVGEVVRSALSLDLPVIVVDDGSTDASFGRVRSIDGVRILRHRTNRGKGAALLTGMAEAAKTADWAVTLDADGQHHPEYAPALIAAIPDGSRPIVVGARRGMRSARAPWTSRFGREFSNFWVRTAGGPEVADTQSGFRVYPLPEALRLGVRSRRFQFEVEILVRAAWNRIPVIEAPVRVLYRPGSERISHFHPFFDFLRNFGMFARLITCRVATSLFSRE